MMKPACARGSQAGTTRLTQRVGLPRGSKSSHLRSQSPSVVHPDAPGESGVARPARPAASHMHPTAPSGALLAGDPRGPNPAGTARDPFPLREERELNLLWASTAIIATFYALLDTVSEWSAGHGVAPATAADYTASMAHTLARVALSGGTDRFARLAAEAATPGGLNEQVVGMLRAGGACADVRGALDAVLARISPQPPTA